MPGVNHFTPRLWKVRLWYCDLESARELSFKKHMHYRDYNYIYIYILLYLYICNKYIRAYFDTVGAI